SGMVIFSEMVTYLFSQGNSQAAIHLERLWNDLAETYTFSRLCAYPARGFKRQENHESFLKSFAEHSAAILDQSCPSLPSQGARSNDSFPSELTTEIQPRHQGVLLEALSDCVICMLDSEGRITSWSGGQGQFQGHKGTDVVGMSFSRFYP